MLLRAAGVPEPTPQHRVELLGDALVPARLRVAGGEGVLRVRSVQVARRAATSTCTTTQPSPRARDARLVRRASDRRRARLRGPARDPPPPPTPPPRRLTRPRDRCVPDTTHCVGHGRIGAPGQRCLPARWARRAWRATARSIKAVQQARVTARRSLPTDFGYIEIGVKPGMVLSSLTRNSPSARRKKSTAGHRLAAARLERPHRERAHLRGLGVGQRRGDEQLGLAVFVLVGVVVELGAPARLRRAPMPRADRRRAQPTSISRPTIASSATIHSSYSSACAIAASSSGAIARLRHADRRAHVRRLHEARQPELGLDPIGELGDVVRVAQREVARLRQARRPRTRASS